MDQFRIGTGERLRFDLAILRAQWTVGADGGLAHIRNLLESFGFSEVLVWVDAKARPSDWPHHDADVLEFPAWPAWCEGTWQSTGTDLKTDWPEMRVLRRYAAPARQAPASLPPPVSVPNPSASPAEEVPASYVPQQAPSIYSRAGISRAEMQVAAGLAVAGLSFGLLWVFVSKPAR